ncbi:MAG: hypothetical protein JO266_21690 [Acidobacteria bacterium]|nr:hypothetical protein [Acidobacteriota bacterium]
MRFWFIVVSALLLGAGQAEPRVDRHHLRGAPAAEDGGSLSEIGSGFTLVNRGSTSRNVPVRFGYGFARRDMPPGNTIVCKDESGNTYPCQIDQLSTRTSLPHASDTPGWLHGVISLNYTSSWTAGARHTFHIYKQSGAYSPGTGLAPLVLTSAHHYEILYQNVKDFSNNAIGSGNFTCDLNSAITAGGAAPGTIVGVGGGVSGGGGGYTITENGSVETTIEALTPAIDNVSGRPHGQIMCKFFVMMWQTSPGSRTLGNVELVGWIGQPWQNNGSSIGFNWGDVSLYDAATSTILRSYSRSSNFAPSDVLPDPATWSYTSPDGHVGAMVGQFGAVCGTTRALCPGGGYGTTLNVSGSTVTESGGSIGWNYYGSMWNNAYIYIGSGNVNCNQGKYKITSAVRNNSFTINNTGLGASCSSISNWQIASGFIKNYDNLQSGLGITFSATNGTLPFPLQAGQLYFAGTAVSVNQNDSSQSHNALSPYSVWKVPNPSGWLNGHQGDEIGVYNQGTCNRGGACFTVTRHSYLLPWTGIWLMADDNAHPFWIAGSNRQNTTSLYPQLSNAQKTYFMSTALIPPYNITSPNLVAPSPSPITYFNNNAPNNGGPYYEGSAVGPQETVITPGGNHEGLGNMSGFAANWFLNSTQANWDLVNNDALSASTMVLGALLNAETGYITPYDCGTYPKCGAYTTLTKNGTSPSAHENDFFLWPKLNNQQSSGFTTYSKAGLPSFNSAQDQTDFIGGVYYSVSDPTNSAPTHYPDFSDPMAYIIGGQPWMLRQLQWWSEAELAYVWTYPSNAINGRDFVIKGVHYWGRLCFGQEEQRGPAWKLRSVMWGAVLGADNDPQRAYFWNEEIENMDNIYASMHLYYGQNINNVSGGSPDPNYEVMGYFSSEQTDQSQFQYSYIANVLQENYALTHYTSNVLPGASALYAAEQAILALVQFWVNTPLIPDIAGHTMGLYWAGAEGFQNLRSINGTMTTPGVNPVVSDASGIGIIDGPTGYLPTSESNNYLHYSGIAYNQNSQGLIENGDMIWAGGCQTDSCNALKVLGNARYFVINVTPNGSSPPTFQLTTVNPRTQSCSSTTGTTGCPAAFIPSGGWGSAFFNLAWRPQANPSTGLGGYGGGATGYAASTYSAFQMAANYGVPLAGLSTALNNNQARNPLSSYYLSQNAVDGLQWQSWYMGPVTVPQRTRR